MNYIDLIIPSKFDQTQARPWLHQPVKSLSLPPSSSLSLSLPPSPLAGSDITCAHSVESDSWSLSLSLHSRFLSRTLALSLSSFSHISLSLSDIWRPLVSEQQRLAVIKTTTTTKAVFLFVRCSEHTFVYMINICRGTETLMLSCDPEQKAWSVTVRGNQTASFLNIKPDRVAFRR